jgi:hypothetical protein
VQETEEERGKMLVMGKPLSLDVATVLTILVSMQTNYAIQGLNAWALSGNAQGGKRVLEQASGRGVWMHYYFCVVLFQKEIATDLNDTVENITWSLMFAMMLEHSVI